MFNDQLTPKLSILLYSSTYYRMNLTHESIFFNEITQRCHYFGFLSGKSTITLYNS